MARIGRTVQRLGMRRFDRSVIHNLQSRKHAQNRGVE
jgi:hypothetical protein